MVYPKLIIGQNTGIKESSTSFLTGLFYSVAGTLDSFA